MTRSRTTSGESLGRVERNRNHGNPLFSQNNARQQHAVLSSSSNDVLSIRGGGATLLFPGNVDAFLNAMDLMGTAVFAFSGALTAGKKGMDILGMLIVATITSCGGGTLRDLLLNDSPIGQPAFWMKEPIYLQICMVVTLLTFMFWPTLEQKLGWKGSEIPVCTADAVGLAAFAVLGTQRAAAVRQSSLHPLIWIVSGLMSSCFGGVIRDLICLQRPRIMYPFRTMYSPGPIIGSTLYAALVRWTHWETQIIASIAFLATFVIRVSAFNNPTRMPHWKNGTVNPHRQHDRQQQPLVSDLAAYRLTKQMAKKKNTV